MSSRKNGGLGSNPLLTRTDPGKATGKPVDPVAPEVIDARLRVDTQTRVHADTSISKFTFYFTVEQLDRLDTVWQQLRRTNRHSGQRLSKSHMVRVALNRLLDEFDQNPDAVIAELKQQLEG